MGYGFRSNVNPPNDLQTFLASSVTLETELPLQAGWTTPKKLLAIAVRDRQVDPGTRSVFPKLQTPVPVHGTRVRVPAVLFAGTAGTFLFFSSKPNDGLLDKQAMDFLQSRPWPASRASHQLREQATSFASKPPASRASHQLREQAMACFESKWLAREACHGLL
ncbi:hypothetical protein PCASD_05981 [Puccinia coronata f. sp. avenae]|nr:hypothetical protein PCASD_05981 [Puccinia coronata f. sp. avenae]